VKTSTTEQAIEELPFGKCFCRRASGTETEAGPESQTTEAVSLLQSLRTGDSAGCAGSCLGSGPAQRRGTGRRWSEHRTDDRDPEKEETFLDEIQRSCRSGTYRAKRCGGFTSQAQWKRAAVGIPTVRDRVVQAAVLLILEPIFEADFEDCSHGFRPGRSAHDALRIIQAT